METKEFKVSVPEGYEIDKENSTFECIKFKKKNTFNYKDVAKALFWDKNVFYIGNDSKIERHISQNEKIILLPANATSYKQCEKILAINKLMNVAKYLNDGWKPDYCNSMQFKYRLRILDGKIDTNISYWINYGVPVFKSEELAKEAIKILGEETIRLALTTDY